MESTMPIYSPETAVPGWFVPSTNFVADGKIWSAMAGNCSDANEDWVTGPFRIWYSPKSIRSPWPDGACHNADTIAIASGTPPLVDRREIPAPHATRLCLPTYSSQGFPSPIPDARTPALAVSARYRRRLHTPSEY